MSNVLDALAAAFVDQGELELAEVVRASSHAREIHTRVALADWVCHILVPLAMDAANLTDDARSLRDMPAMIDGDDDVWQQRLEAFVETRARDAETSAYENAAYKAVITVAGADDASLVICARAVEQALGPEVRAVAVACRALVQLVGPAVVDFDYWRGRSFSVPSGCTDSEADRECDRAEQRYRRFFDLDSAVKASLESVLRALAGDVP